MPTLTRSYLESLEVDTGVYVPQQDSDLLIEAATEPELITRARALDFCTGSGVVAIALAQAGMAEVSAWDICPRAVRCAQSNVCATGTQVHVRRGSLAEAVAEGPYDLVVSNPPYVPAPQPEQGQTVVTGAGPAWEWNAGEDGRLVLDPLCRVAGDLLAPGGSLLLVQSEFSGVDQTLAALKASGLSAAVVMSRRIAFGPVLTARAAWLERTGRLEPGLREEELVVIRADKS